MVSISEYGFTKKELEFLDFLFHFLHISLIVWNVMGWLFRKLRFFHWLTLNMVFISWFFLGFFYGFGYCILTDFHWQIKYLQGETYLPSSYIEFLLRKIDFSFPSIYIDMAVLIVTLCVYFLSSFLLWKQRKWKRT